MPSQAIATGPALADAPVTPNANHYGNDSFIITAQLYGNDATIYKRKGFTVTYDHTLTSYAISAPAGTATTPNDYWYLTNMGHSNVLVYKIKKNFPTYPNNVLDDYGQLPDNVSATADRNLVAVSNQATTTGGAGSVSVYLNRQSEPTRILTYGTDQLQGEGIAIDHQGDCFWSFNDPNINGGAIVEFAGCDGTGTELNLGTITKAGGVAFDQSGNMYYVDQAYGIYKCVKTSNCKLFVSNVTYGIGQPNNLNFDYKEKALWLSDASGYFWGIDLKGKCNHGGPCVYQYSSVDGDPYGIAPSPGD